MTIQQITKLIEEAEGFKNIAQGYEEIASLKLKRIRNDTEKNRVFFDEITSVYKLVHQIASTKNIVPQNKNGKIISIALTSNYRFYGAINTAILRFFMINTAKFSTDRIVIGQSGNNYLKSIHYFNPYKSVILKNDLPTAEEIKELSDLVFNYSKVLLFHTQFKTVLKQEPVIKDITGTYIVNPNKKGGKNGQNKSLKATSNPLLAKGRLENIDFIFEPELSLMLQFFDNQITGLLLEQTFLEAELSRTASRLIAMDEAQSNADDYIKDQTKQLLNSKRSIKNIRLLEVISGMYNFLNKEPE